MGQYINLNFKRTQAYQIIDESKKSYNDKIMIKS